MITLLIVPLMITPADPSVDDHATGSQRSADPLTVGHTVRVSQLMITLLILPLMITSADPSVDDHSSVDHSVQQITDCESHCPRIAQTADHR